jgi:Na+-driven multidrug efflux pump
MMIFISSTILIWLSEPLLSLVDTTIVGQYAKKNAVVQLAALGPATLLIDSAIYLTYFLAIATTNTIANALASKDYHELQRSSSQVLGLATILGGAITFSIFGFGEPLVQWAAGGSSSPALTKMAMEYCKIRSAVAPMAILGMVAQSICLASLDTFTPALAVAVASLVNVVGDLALVPKWGIQGAGAATAAASVASTMVLLNQVYRKMRTWQELGYQTLTNGNAQISTVINGAPVLGYADSTKVKKYVPSKIPFLSLPDPTALLQLMKMAGPIFFCIVGKIMCYSAMTLRVTDFGVTALAAHNIMMRVFFFFSTFGDAVSQASQTFLPSVLKSGRKNALKLVQRLGVLATLIGVFNNCMFHINLTRLGHHFTREMPILELMANHADWAGWSLLMHPFIMLFEGSILATQDVLYLTGSYAVTMACHFSNLRFSAKTFGGVWHALFLFQVFRFSQFLWRVSKTLSTEQAEAETPSSTEGVVSSAPLDTV